MELNVELRWPPGHYPAAAEELREELMLQILDASPTLADAVQDRRAQLHVRLLEPGALTLDRKDKDRAGPRLVVRERLVAVSEDDG
jgi:hypothetical protein